MTVKRREETESKVPECGALPPGHLRNRACLLVSLIILVWNVGSSWRHFASAGIYGKTSINDASGKARADSEGPAPAGNCTLKNPAMPLNVRQNFLLGKKIDINRAGWREITGLPGISDKVAASVEETRKRIGGYKRPEDLLQVRGIKEKKLKKILPFISGFANN